MPEYACTKCSSLFASPSALKRHMKKKNACDVGRLQCQDCAYRCDDHSNMSKHKKTCKGKRDSIASVQKELKECRMILAATGNQRRDNQSSSSHVSNNTVSGDIINGDQINIIQNNNIVVLPACKEDIEHIKNLTIEQLKAKIGFNRDVSTHVELFKMIRADETRPENNTMLLPNPVGKTIHYQSEEGWKVGVCDDQLYNALFTDNRTLIQDFAKIEKSYPDYYNGHLLQTVNQMINNNDRMGLQPYFEAYRKALHQLTLKLAEKNKGFEADQRIEFQENASSDLSEMQWDVKTETHGDNVLSDQEFALRQMELENENKKLDVRKLELQLKLKGVIEA